MIKKRQRYRAGQGLTVPVLHMYRAPYTGGGERVPFPAGEVLVVATDPLGDATSAILDAERYAEMEPVLVPESIRLGTKYTGYYIVIPAGELERDWQLIESGDDTANES